MSATAQTLRPPSKTLMFLEGRAFHEFGAFLGALPLLNLAPRGDGHPVLVLPGFMASDESTGILRRYLKRLGHASHPWLLGRNIGSPNFVRERLVDRAAELYARYERKISIVGWSLGGIYAREIAKLGARQQVALQPVETIGKVLIAAEPVHERQYHAIKFATERMLGIVANFLEKRGR